MNPEDPKNGLPMGAGVRDPRNLDDGPGVEGRRTAGGVVDQGGVLRYDNGDRWLEVRSRTRRKEEEGKKKRRKKTKV